MIFHMILNPDFETEEQFLTTLLRNFDVEMTMDMLDDVEKMTTIMLFSGDCDMCASLERLKVKGKKIGIFGVRGMVAGELHLIKDKYFNFGKFYTGKRTYIKSENPAFGGIA